MLSLQILPPDTKARAVINCPNVIGETVTLPVFAVIAVLKQDRITATVSPECIPITIFNGSFVVGANKVFIDEP